MLQLIYIHKVPFGVLHIRILLIDWSTKVKWDLLNAYARIRYSTIVQRLKGILFSVWYFCAHKFSLYQILICFRVELAKQHTWSGIVKAICCCYVDDCLNDCKAKEDFYTIDFYFFTLNCSPLTPRTRAT